MYIVSGGGTGIGRAVALALHEAGKSVTVVGRRARPLEEVAAASGGAITPVVADCSRPAEVRALADRLDRPVAGLVNAAGGNPALGRDDPDSLDGSLALLQDTMSGNLGTAVALCEGLAPHMATGASVVLFGSIAAEAGVGFYGPAKAAVASYAVGRAHALGPLGIRVNCVSPGYIEGTEFFPGGLAPEREEQLRAATALGRVGTPDQVSDLVLFLLSPASAHLTGQNIHINGGAFTTR